MSQHHQSPTLYSIFIFLSCAPMRFYFFKGLSLCFRNQEECKKPRADGDKPKKPKSISLSYGMNGYISKPIREEQLHNLINQFLKKNIVEEIQIKNIDEAPYGRYKVISLEYMKEISAGNKDYEKTVTGQFIETVPGDLAALEKAWQNKDIAVVRQLAHNMKTTISVMGLNEKLQPYLDALEYETLTGETFQKNVSSIDLVLTAALTEAHSFYSTF